MADIGQMAVEKFSAKWREYTVNEGAASAQTPGEYDWGTADDGAFTYASIVRDGVFLIFDTATDFTVKRPANSAQGKTLIGVALGAPQGKAGGVREVRCIHFTDWDVVRVQAGGAIAVGDKVSLGTYDLAVPHGFKVVADNTHGFGYALNSTAADGEYLALLMKPGTYAQA